MAEESPRRTPHPPRPPPWPARRKRVVEPPQMMGRVKREPVAKCLTCPLCHKLLRDATTISMCLHTFCRKCILEKLNEEDSCPICNIDLGCVPADHNLQDLRAKIFPYKRVKVEAPEVLSSVSIPVKRKERSLSSLVVTTPRVGNQSGLTGRRTKTSRKAAGLCRLSPVISATIKKPLENVTDCKENSILFEAPAKMTFIRKS
ncbi:putative transcription factor C2H2 family [Dioscorea sansibarensis]